MVDAVWLVVRIAASRVCYSDFSKIISYRAGLLVSGFSVHGPEQSFIKPLYELGSVLGDGSQ